LLKARIQIGWLMSEFDKFMIKAVTGP